jgi:hypothetical protein
MRPREVGSFEQRQDSPIYSDPPIYSVSDFCKAHCIARSFLYLLLREGRGPRLTKLGRRTLITREAAAEWRAQMEKLGTSERS